MDKSQEWINRLLEACRNPSADREGLGSMTVKALGLVETISADHRWEWGKGVALMQVRLDFTVLTASLLRR